MQFTKPDLEIPTYSLNLPGSTLNRNLRILSANAEGRHQRSEFLAPHRKDYYLLVYVKKGNSRHWVDMTAYTLKPETFYFTVPPQVHLKEEAQPLTGTLIAFTEEFLAMGDNQMLKKLPLIQNPHNGHELVLKEKDKKFIEDLLGKLLDEYEESQQWQNEMLMAYIRVLLIHLSRLYNEQYSNHELFTDRQVLRRFQSLIEQRHQTIHEVTGYAGLLNVSAGHLNTLVKQQSSKTAIEHIHERLILEAKRLLFHTEQSIKEIAFTLGFEDAPYFNRFFKRITTQTPATYRQSAREMYH